MCHCLGRLCHSPLVAEVLSPAYDIVKGQSFQFHEHLDVKLSARTSVFTQSSAAIAHSACQCCLQDYTLFHPPTKPHSLLFWDWRLDTKMQTVKTASVLYSFQLLFAAPLQRKHLYTYWFFYLPNWLFSFLFSRQRAALVFEAWTQTIARALGAGWHDCLFVKAGTDFEGHASKRLMWRRACVVFKYAKQ